MKQNKELKHIIMVFAYRGILKEVIVDNGTEFKNSVVKDLLNLQRLE